jgi:hypothetical protein
MAGMAVPAANSLSHGFAMECSNIVVQSGYGSSKCSGDWRNLNWCVLQRLELRKKQTD